MPWIAYIGPFVPFIALLPPSIAAIIIGTRWIKSREGGGGSQVHAELEDLRQEIAALQERLDFNERMLSQLREGKRELPRE